MRTKAIASAKVKTDKVDAKVLAQLGAAQFVPEVWAPDAQTRVLRRRIAHRASLVKQRTRLRNQIHAVLARNLVELEVTDVFGQKGRGLLAEVELAAHEREQVDSALRLHDALDQEIGLAERPLAEHALGNEDVRRLMTIPGVGALTALSIVGVIGEVERFATPRQLVGGASASCARLARARRSSSSSSSSLRSACAEAAARSRRSPPRRARPISWISTRCAVRRHPAEGFWERTPGVAAGLAAHVRSSREVEYRRMAFVSRFDTPGPLRDLPDGSPFYDRWHELVAGIINPHTSGSGSGEFFDPSESDFDPELEPSYVWMGFPRPHMVVDHRDDREAAFEAGESRLAQHEYLEWHVTRAVVEDKRSKITKVTFVTETPEYWEALAKTEPERLLELYRELVGPAVAKKDLFDGDGNYVPDNPWNSDQGIVHYIMGINGIAPLINAEQDTPIGPDALDNYDAMPLRFANGTPLLTAADSRFSLDIGVLSRQGLSLTVREPLGLYMLDWDDTGWTKPDGTPVGNYWRIVRGSPGAALRLDYEVPASEGFVVGDISIGGRPIRFGGQLAEHITVMAGGLAGETLP